MKFSARDVETFDKEYLEILEVLRNNAQISKDDLLSKKITAFQSENPKAEIAIYLRSLYKNLMFFKSDELLKKLKQFNLRELELRWFTSIDEINQQFDLIIEK